jgi:hypothetical protein
LEQISVALQQKEALCPPITASFSSKYTLTPALANSNAEATPDMPDPTTKTFLFSKLIPGFP